MKRVTTLTITLFIGFLAFSQKSWIGFSLGANHGQISYRNSDGVLDQNLKGLPTGMTSIFFQTQVFSPKKELYPSATMLSMELGYKPIRIKDKSSSLLNTWALNYLSSNLTIRRRANSRNRVNLFYGGGIAMDWLISGEQNLGLQRYSLNEDLSSINIGLVGEIGVSYFIGSDVYSSLGLGYQRGFTDLEKSIEEALLHSIDVSMSVFFGF